ncbi:MULTISPECIES: NifB/NifX family molybdenum-iron cluster-binding protein [Caldisericum]|jgi:predicted Fe-Mo cluster-binding NifX family protein|uniref:NifB/NifX family molybdenum-iron cluster-binding protein n=1 Tax=Caldisericum TaxID=693074 RepID=UPI0039FC1574
MIVAITSSGNTLDSMVDPRFGRCPYFIIVDTDTMQFKVIENSGMGRQGGAGVNAAQLLVDEGVQVLISGNVGPNAEQALKSGGIRIITGVSGTVKEVIEKLKRGEI